MLPSGVRVQSFRPISKYEAMTAAIECLRGRGLSLADGDRVLTDPQFKFTHAGASPTVKARYSYFRRVVMPWIADLVGVDGASLLLRGLHAEAADGLAVPRELIDATAALREARHVGHDDWEIVHRRGEYRVESRCDGGEGLSAAQALTAATVARADAKLREMKEDPA
ncbi:MAG: hypothetical protein BGO49_00580 [Planctomycetales bacterium 71-10]|nr:MAG: hypothetical protein BGO49_00580 [Planctomycetales bacterium 71-10]